MLQVPATTESNRTPNPPAPQEEQQRQGNLAQPAALAPAARPASPAASINAASESLQCQWQGCSERCSTPGALYEHVCERHVGRKSTNSLNLNCAWADCRTTTVKRDHLTSHIRVHVPLKPHKCELCGKAFKRPQDLKKHVKTHADDSAIMHLTNFGTGRGHRHQDDRTQGGDNHAHYDQGLSSGVALNYYAPAMPSSDYAGQSRSGQDYQPYPPGPAGQHPGYGPVTYYSAASSTALNYEAHKRGYDALNDFFGQVKRRELDPINFQIVSRRLFELQDLQLPQIVPSVVAIPAYQPVSMANDYEQTDPIQAYSLPPMGNVKTREDLASIDQILEQMQTTIYENESSQTDVVPSGLSFVDDPASQSTPSATLLLSSDNTSALQHQRESGISTSSTINVSTPGFTSSSSAQSDTSGRSPLQSHASLSSTRVYPNLPQGDTDYATTQAATLSNMYDDDERRRYSGGMLQRAAPAKHDEIDIRSSRSASPSVSSIKQITKGESKASFLDENLNDTPLFRAASTAQSESKEPDSEQIWVQNMRLIEWMRELLKKGLESGEFGDKGEHVIENEQNTAMDGVEEHKSHEKGKHEQLYPELKHI